MALTGHARAQGDRHRFLSQDHHNDRDQWLQRGPCALAGCVCFDRHRTIEPASVAPGGHAAVSRPCFAPARACLLRLRASLPPLASLAASSLPCLAARCVRILRTADRMHVFSRSVPPVTESRCVLSLILCCRSCYSGWRTSCIRCKSRCWICCDRTPCRASWCRSLFGLDPPECCNMRGPRSRYPLCSVACLAGAVPLACAIDWPDSPVGSLRFFAGVSCHS